jgi:hypothetical protein
MVNGKWMTEIAECVSTLSVPILIDKSARKLHRQLGSHCMLSDCFLQALICTTHIFHILYNNDESDGKSKKKKKTKKKKKKKKVNKL